MSTAQDGWYLSEPEADEAVGPMPRSALAAELASGRWSPGVVAWHVDLSEWRPLARLLGAAEAYDPNLHQAGLGGNTPTQRQPAVHAAEGQGQPAPDRRSKAERAEERRRRKALKDQALRTTQDDGRRLLSSDPPPGMDAEAIAAARAAQQQAQTRTPSAARNDARANEAIKAAAGQTALVMVRRLLARLIDTLTLGALGAAVVYGWIARQSSDPAAASAPEPLALVLTGTLVLVPFEALALAIFRTTPGKALLGLKVCDRAGGRPGPIDAFRRAFTVWWRGMGLGVPVLAQVAWIVALAQSHEHGTTPWDRALGLNVRAEALDAGRWQAAAFALIAAIMVLNSTLYAELASWVALVSFQN